MRLVLPSLYVILDATLVNNSPHVCAQELAAAGVRLLQTRLVPAFHRMFFDCE